MEKILAILLGVDCVRIRGNSISFIGSLKETKINKWFVHSYVRNVTFMPSKEISAFEIVTEGATVCEVEYLNTFINNALLRIIEGGCEELKTLVEKYNADV